MDPYCAHWSSKGTAGNPEGNATALIKQPTSVFYWQDYAITRRLLSFLQYVLVHLGHMFLCYLNYFTGCPSRGDVISTWICMCLLHNQSAEGMLAWDWWSSWIMRKASLFVGPPGHRDLTLWVWPALGYCIVDRFPTSLSLFCTATHQRGGRKWLFIDGSVGSCAGTQ